MSELLGTTLIIIVEASLIQYFLWRILKELELIHQRVGWMQKDVQKICELAVKKEGE